MCTRNAHLYKPRGLCGWLLLACSYSPCLFAVVLIALNVLPFHLVFLPHIESRCVEGAVSWVYYYYCVLVMVFAEVMVYGNYFFAIATAPGYVKNALWSMAPVYEGRAYSDNPFEVTQLDRHGKLRYCTPCAQFKPDNAHHCSVCGRCIYRMDHHCPWINNCVGRNNAKYFLLFIGYIPVGAFHIVLTTAYSCYYHFPDVDFTFTTNALYPTLIYVISILFSLAMGICFGCFAGHFLYMTYRGETSISASVARKTAGAGDKAQDDLMRAERKRLENKSNHVYDIFGADRRWWKMVCCFAPARDGRGLLGETPPSLTSNGEKLV